MGKLPNRESGEPYTFDQVVRRLVNAPPQKSDAAPSKKRAKKAPSKQRSKPA